MRLAIILGSVSVVLTCLLPIGGSAQSFNCRTADRPDEILICQDSRLSALDEQMSNLYFKVRNSARDAERRQLQTSQASWLRSRIACGRDFECIKQHYERRIAELNRPKLVIDECNGILHVDRNGVYLGGEKSEGICVVNDADIKTVLGACTIGRPCIIKGVTDYCKDSGECVEISNVISAQRR